MTEDQIPQEDQNEEIPIVNPEELNQDLPDEYIPKKIESEEGGVGSIYKVSTSTWNNFRSAVMGHGYDIDNFFGWQCWDGAALLWQQFGLALLTGNGMAIGCWDLKRNTNKYTKFTLVTSVNSLKKGDVVVMRPNHIGFFNGYADNYMIIDGQNQGGKPGPNGGMAFNEVRITKAAFAGAFRLKKWHPVSTVAYHRVVSGETLYSIAKHYHTTLARLVSWNKAKYPSLVKNPNLIRIGWRLRVK